MVYILCVVDMLSIQPSSTQPSSTQPSSTQPSSTQPSSPPPSQPSCESHMQNALISPQQSTWDSLSSTVFAVVGWVSSSFSESEHIVLQAANLCPPVDDSQEVIDTGASSETHSTISMKSNDTGMN